MQQNTLTSKNKSATDIGANSDATPLIHIAFYKFSEISDPCALVCSLRHLARDLLGSIIVAPEGINGVLVGTSAALDAFERMLTDPLYCNGAFFGMAFRRSGCKTLPFARLKIHLRSELVALGVTAKAGDNRRATTVTPQQWRVLLAADDVIVIDNRNSFEARLGRFKTAIDPQVSNFSEFSRYIEAHLPTWQAAGKRVAMYCTGGIRCEKTSAWMQDRDIDVYQLEGGILNYFQTMADADLDWEGECFVFDNRIALDTRLQETNTTAEEVYNDSADAWRLSRARRLAAAQ